MADSVAIIALGVISKNLGDVNDVKDKTLFEITVFSAPLLLLHLVTLIPFWLIAWKIIRFG